jgi:hypothetical protein
MDRIFRMLLQFYAFFNPVNSDSDIVVRFEILVIYRYACSAQNKQFNYRLLIINLLSYIYYSTSSVQFKDDNGNLQEQLIYLLCIINRGGVIPVNQR